MASIARKHDIVNDMFVAGVTSILIMLLYLKDQESIEPPEIVYFLGMAAYGFVIMVTTQAIRFKRTRGRNRLDVCILGVSKAASIACILFGISFWMVGMKTYLLTFSCLILTVTMGVIPFKFTNPYPRWARILLTILPLYFFAIVIVDGSMNDSLFLSLVMSWPLFLIALYVNDLQLRRLSERMNNHRFFTSKKANAAFWMVFAAMAALFVASLLFFVLVPCMNGETVVEYEPFLQGRIEGSLVLNVACMAILAAMDADWMLWAKNAMKKTESKWLATGFLLIAVGSVPLIANEFLDWNDSMASDLLFILSQSFNMTALAFMIVFIHKRGHSAWALIGMVLFVVPFTVIFALAGTGDLKNSVDGYNYECYLLIDFLLSRGFLGVKKRRTTRSA